MNEIAELARQINHEKIERARAMSISEKLLAGPRLFEEECAEARREIRSIHADWSEDQVETELASRLEIDRRAKDAVLARFWGDANR